MAVCSLVQQWNELRQYLQDIWRRVAYEGLNSAVAAALSNISVGMIKEAESQIFIDFSGDDSFEAMIMAITGGDPETAQGSFHARLHRISPGENPEVATDAGTDTREELMFHCYRDLLDFLTNYQQNGNGKPTRAMLKEINGWNPESDLRLMTKTQRLKWRRSYTINWLYDLVNVNTSVAVQVLTLERKAICRDTVDWSAKGPSNDYRGLFGVNGFAGEIAHLAAQNPGAETKRKILPHIVFQLQCLVDSMTVSRGWSFDSSSGHVLTSPAENFRARRDVELFMDHSTDRVGNGFCAGVDWLDHLFDKDSVLHGDPNLYQVHKHMLAYLRANFGNWLGKYTPGPDIPGSRFSDTNANGVWEYSPFLCGAGLMEALELAQGGGFLLWDDLPEPICAIHLHNMLVRKGYISQPVGLYIALEEIFKDCVFINGQAPDSDFYQALLPERGEWDLNANYKRSFAVTRKLRQTSMPF